jgi:hypothetical protein
MPQLLAYLGFSFLAFGLSVHLGDVTMSRSIRPSSLIITDLQPVRSSVAGKNVNVEPRKKDK